MQFFIQSYVVIVPILIGWIVGTSYLQLRGQFRPSPLRYIVLTAFVIYLLALVHATGFPIHVHTGVAKQNVVFHDAVNLVPLLNFRPFDFVLNIGMTLPLGLFLPVVFRRRFKVAHIVVIGILLGTTIELIQLLMRQTIANDRFVDINDVIANASGVVIGYGVYRYSMNSVPLRPWVSAAQHH